MSIYGYLKIAINTHILDKNDSLIIYSFIKNYNDGKGSKEYP